MVEMERRGGSCLLIRIDLDSVPLQITSQLATPYEFECYGAELTNYNLIIVCIYTIPKSNITIFFDKLRFPI